LNRARNHAEEEGCLEPKFEWVAYCSAKAGRARHVCACGELASDIDRELVETSDIDRELVETSDIDRELVETMAHEHEHGGNDIDIHKRVRSGVGINAQLVIPVSTD